jgi:transcriptional regulator with XRE-family HTH domain
MSPKRHPLAVLRLLIGKSQKEMAELAGCSAVAIQRIELCSLPLSDKLGSKIVFETGVSLTWLMAGKPDAPCLDAMGRPYTKKTFEKGRVRLENPQGDADADDFARWVMQHAVTRLAAIQAQAVHRKKLDWFCYRLADALEALEGEFGICRPVMQTAVPHKKRPVPAVPDLSKMAKTFCAALRIFRKQKSNVMPPLPSTRVSRGRPV